MLQGRGLNASARRDGYRVIVDGAPTSRTAMVHASGPAAETAAEHKARERRRPCKVYVSEPDAWICDRCHFTLDDHIKAWRSA